MIAQAMTNLIDAATAQHLLDTLPRTPSLAREINPVLAEHIDLRRDVLGTRVCNALLRGIYLRLFDRMTICEFRRFVMTDEILRCRGIGPAQVPIIRRAFR